MSYGHHRPAPIRLGDRGLRQLKGETAFGASADAPCLGKDHVLLATWTKSHWPVHKRMLQGRWYSDTSRTLCHCRSAGPEGLRYALTCSNFGSSQLGGSELTHVLLRYLPNQLPILFFYSTPAFGKLGFK